MSGLVTGVSSSDTIRSRSITGKPARQLKSAWTAAWDGPGSPGPLPMPLQPMLVDYALHRVRRADSLREASGPWTRQQLASILLRWGLCPVLEVLRKMPRSSFSLIPTVADCRVPI